MIVVVVAFVFLFNGMDCPRISPAPKGRRVNIGIDGFGPRRVREGVEVSGRNVLPRDRYNIGLRERAITIG
jgi:hypothetical protein